MLLVFLFIVESFTAFFLSMPLLGNAAASFASTFSGAQIKWTEEDLRMHQWIYSWLIEDMDRQIGTILDGMKENGQADNTYIIFTLDHGDMDGAHKMEHKGYFYEESKGGTFHCQRAGSEKIVEKSPPSVTSFTGDIPAGNSRYFLFHRIL